MPWTSLHLFSCGKEDRQSTLPSFSIMYVKVFFVVKTLDCFVKEYATLLTLPNNKILESTKKKVFVDIKSKIDH